MSGGTDYAFKRLTINLYGKDKFPEKIQGLYAFDSPLPAFGILHAEKPEVQL